MDYNQRDQSIKGNGLLYHNSWLSDCGADDSKLIKPQLLWVSPVISSSVIKALFEEEHRRQWLDFSLRNSCSIVASASIKHSWQKATSYASEGILTSPYQAARRHLAMNLVVLNHDQVTGTTHKLAFWLLVPCCVVVAVAEWYGYRIVACFVTSLILVPLKDAV
ncbi:hypothetical protein TNCV_2976541 [Trichonephila clavipes]|nr:hypothetical protein TNCV_2976541 [Trichonephila clavipes]